MATLAQIQDEPTSEAGLTILRRVLASKFSIAVARVAKLVGAWELLKVPFMRSVSTARTVGSGNEYSKLWNNVAKKVQLRGF
jgi:hypothetical protein